MGWVGSAFVQVSRLGGYIAWVLSCKVSKNGEA